MKLNLKKALCVCASALMMLSMAAPAVNAKSNPSGVNTNAKTQRVMHHIDAHKANEAKISHLKQLHAQNLERFNRIKRHIVNHQKNLQRIAQHLHRYQNQPRKHNARYVAMINRWNDDKARLVHSIETNEHGMVRLAEQVNSERHAIDLIKHPTTAKRVVNPEVSPVQTNQYPANDNKGSYGKFAGSFYSDDNGDVNQGSIGATDNNGSVNATAYLNGKPVVLNQDLVNGLKSEWNRFNDNFALVDAQMKNFDNQLDQQVQNEIKDFFD